MPRLQFLLLTLSIFVLGCDVQERPIADPAEQLERGSELFRAGSFQQAEALLTTAAEAFEAQHLPGNAARARGVLAQIHLANGRYRGAVRELTVALELSKRANDFRNKAHLSTLFGNTYTEMGMYAQAATSYRSAAALYSAFNDRRAVADLDLRIGRALFLDGALERAYDHLERARQFFTSANNSVLAAQASALLAQVHLRQGALTEAQSVLAEALSKLGSADPVVEAILRLHFGKVLNRLRGPNAALEQLQTAANTLRTRKVGKELESVILFQIGTVYADHGRYNDARTYYTEAGALAKAAGDRLGEQYTQLMLTLAHERGMPADQRTRNAEQLARAYLTVAEGFSISGHRTGEAYANAQAARLFALRGERALARQHLQKAVEVEERIEGEFIHPEYHKPYLEYLQMAQERERWHDMLAEILLKQDNTAEAVGYVERGVSKRLYRRLREIDPALHHPQVQQEVKVLRERLQRLRILEVERSRLQARVNDAVAGAEINILHAEIESLREDLTHGAARIAARHPNYDPLVHISGIGVAELQSLMPRGAVAVYYLPGADELSIFTISRTRFEMARVPIGREALLRLVSDYQRLLHDPNVYAGVAGEASLPFMTRFETLATELFAHLFQPIERYLDRNVLIVPSVWFEGFPFHALQRQDAAGNVKYLIELMNVDYLPSFGALRFRTVSPARMRDIVAVGNPTGRNWSIDYELRDIRSFYKEAHILIGLEASWDRLETMRGDVLQLSVEFVGDRGNGAFGSFWFSDGKTAGEALNIPFERLTQLPVYPVVVISNQHGQGVGLTPVHAFLLRIHGTSDVFFNAWYADRKAAKFFSEFFFTHLSNGLAPGDAYRQALLNLIRTKDVNHPRSWAKFFHYGVG